MSSKKLYSFVLLFSLLSFLFNTSLTFIFAQNRFCEIIIVNNYNKKINLIVEIAETRESQAKGLMFRKNLDINKGMLFVFTYETLHEFWMKNTYIPLNIAYISGNGIINEIYNMKPIDTSITYPSKKKALFALEVNKDWFKNNNISEGCKVIFNGCIRK